MPGDVSLSDSKGKFFQFGYAHDELNSCCQIESSQSGIFGCIFPIFLAPSGIPFGDKTVGGCNCYSGLAPFQISRN